MATKLVIFVTVFSLVAVFSDAAVIGNKIARANSELNEYLSMIKTKYSAMITKGHRVR